MNSKGFQYSVKYNPKTLHYPERFLEKSQTPITWNEPPFRGSVRPIPAFRGSTVFSLELNTEAQADCEDRYEHKMKRVTVSRFEDICRALINNDKSNIANELIYGSRKKYIRKGPN